MKPRNIVIPFVVAAFTLAACGSDETSDSEPGAAESAAVGVTVEDAWVREPAEGQTRAAAYGTITNGADDAVTLVGASVPVGGTFEVHETSVGDDGAMSMSEKDGGFEIAPGESLTLEPGGAHVMMLGIDPADFTGALDVTFVFDSGVEVVTSAELREIGDAMEDMDDMDHSGTGEMEDGDSVDEMEDMDEMEDDG